MQRDLHNRSPVIIQHHLDILTCRDRFEVIFYVSIVLMWVLLRLRGRDSQQARKTLEMLNEAGLVEAHGRTNRSN